MDLAPYATLRPMMGPVPSWLGEEDAIRLEAYSTYQAIYENVPDAFRLVRRGTDTHPIYIPSAKTIVEATNRMLAKRWTYALDPKRGSANERLALDGAFNNLFRREKVWSKFATQKRWGLVRGDQVWHVVADPNKDPGSRISIYEVDPAAYFPITDPWNNEKVLGVHLVVPVQDDAGKTVIKRQTYRKTPEGRISYELSWWQIGAWDDREDDAMLRPADQIPSGELNRPVKFDLDPRITSLPVYHIKNNRSGGIFGTSEIAGLETLIAGINQGISDEDLSLALEGLGLYETTSGPPVDDDGNETNWLLGPGRVVEHDEETEFNRVQGISSVEPYLAHIGKLESAAREASGVPDIAIGNVDVATAESGIALALKMSPLLAKNEEKEGEILSVMDHMLYDLTTMWMPVYEAFATDARVVSIVDDPMPTNRQSTLEEIIALVTSEPPLISADYGRQLLSERLGYDFPEDMFDTIVEESAALSEAADPFSQRASLELAQDAEDSVS